MTPLDDIAAFERDLVVQAGAGTGKTHALVTLYIHLLAGLSAAKRRTPPSRIAVVTFTDKAAGELKDRLRGRIAQLVIAPRKSEPTLAAAAKLLGAPLPDGELWSQALAQLGVAPVGTFHSFAGALLRRNAARVGIDPDFALLDEREAAAMATEAAERAVLDALEQASPEVAELVAEYGYHGAGRARRLVELLVWLRAARAEEGRDASGLEKNYEAGALEWEWARAARSWREKLSSRMAEKNSDKVRAGLQALAAIPVERGCGARLARELETSLKRTRGVEEMRDALVPLCDADASFRAAPLAGALARLISSTEKLYAAAKRRASALDFSDLLVMARDLLRDDEQARTAARARFEAILVDEFQDTNPVQAELVELLAVPPVRRFVVGDRKQSIYEFRGADVGVFTRQARALVERGAREVLLRESRRSAPSLLRFTNALFVRAMAGAPDAPDWAVSFDHARDSLAPFREEDPRACVELLTVNPGEKADAAEARHLEARAIAARLAMLRAEGRRWGEMAILLRRFTALGEYLEALRAAQIPHYVVRGRGFYAAQEVRDLAAALALLDDPDDTIALVTVLRSPLVGISDESLAQLALDSRLRGAILDGRASLDDLEAADRERVSLFAQRFAELRRVADRLGPASCVRALIDGADLRAVLATTREGEQRVANLERLVERARAFEEAGGDLRGFASWLRRVAAPDSGVDDAQAQVVDERDDVVRVMTVHQAKGLEFPVVFVPACGARELSETGLIRYDTDDGLGLKVHDDRGIDFVHSTASRRIDRTRAERRRAESLRLFYVAATRAKDVLIFSGENVRGANKSWRTLLDLVNDASLLRLVDGDALVAPPRREPGVQFSLFGDGGAASALARVVDRPTPRPRAITAAVTQLADFQMCERRYHLFHDLGMLEHPAAARAASADAWDDDGGPPLDPLRRGTLAHRLLERCDFAHPDLEGQLRAEGYEPDDPAVAEVRAHVERFLATPFARALGGKETRRELPFLAAIDLPDGGRLSLRGQIDLLVFDPDAITVVDYKHARAVDSDEYRFQLDAYALAVHRLYPGAPSVRVGLAFLVEGDPSPRLETAALPVELEARLGDLGARLAASRATGGWPGREAPFCREMRCGYVYRCHGGER